MRRHTGTLRRILPWLVAGLVIDALACTESASAPTPPLASIELLAPATALMIGDTIRLQSVVRTADGREAGVRRIVWGSSATAVASVDSTGRVVALGEGQTTISAMADGIRGALALSVEIPTPTIRGVAPDVLQPGTVASLTGARLSARGGLPSLTIGAAGAVIDARTDSSMSFRVPCLPTGAYTARVVRPGAKPAEFSVRVQHRALTLDRGTAILGDSLDSPCFELSAVDNDSARYAIAVFNPSTDPSSVVGFEWLGVEAIPSTPASRVSQPSTTGDAPAGDGVSLREVWHGRHLQRERDASRAFSRDAARRRVIGAPDQTGDSPRTLAASTSPGALRTFFLATTGFCGDTSRRATARAVITTPRLVVWEDTTNTLQSGTNAAYRARLGTLAALMDGEQLPLVTRLVGDPLLRDAETDADGAVHLLLSQQVNESGAAAFVTGCDQRARRLAPASNVGEFIYAMVPVRTENDPESIGTVDGWFAFMPRTIVHELKHLASFAARTARATPFDEVWMEEGSARMIEEAWVSEFVHKRGPRTNRGLGTAADGGLYCDFHVSDPQCAAADRLRRPSIGLRRHFNDLRPRLFAPWDWSPFGEGQGQSGGVFYNTAWSLLRYAADRCCTTDSAFLTALNSTTRSGMGNLEHVSNLSRATLLASWGIAMLLDDRDGVVGGVPDLQIRSWNLPAVYEGLGNSPEWRDRWPASYPLAARAIRPDTSANAKLTGPPLRGGGHAYFELRVVPGWGRALVHIRPASLSADPLRVIIVRTR